MDHSYNSKPHVQTPMWAANGAPPPPPSYGGYGLPGQGGMMVAPPAQILVPPPKPYEEVPHIGMAACYCNKDDPRCCLFVRAGACSIKQPIANCAHPCGWLGYLLLVILYTVIMVLIFLGLAWHGYRF